MRKVLLFATVAATLAAPVYANPATATNGSAAATDGASAASANALGGRSTARSAATGTGGAGGSATASGGHGGRATVTNNVSVGSPGNGSGGGSSGSGGPSYGNNGGGWNGFPVSSAIAPSFWGSSPCTGPGASAAGTAPMFSLSFGGQRMDVSCQALRAEGSPIAEAVLCRENSDYRQARIDIGRPCAADRPAPVETAYAPTKTEWVPAPWCATASEAEQKRHYRDCFRQ